jgi:DNA-directed RNA polymerase I, II, and III subunit RPABC1
MASNADDFEFANVFYRSRITLMELLESRGFEVSPYSRFSPKETKAMSTKFASAEFVAPHKDDPEKKCLVLYLDTKFKGNIPKIAAEKVTDPILDKLEVIALIRDNVTESTDATALNEWLNNKVKVSVFSIYNLANNPTKHVLVPPHEKVPEEQHAALLEKLMLNSKFQLPVIKFHTDMQARWLGLVPGDIVKITRPSPSAGVYEVYRVCTP